MSEPAIAAEKLSFDYDGDEGLCRALSDIDLTVQKGEFVAVLGRNGCGKSTFARLCNALLPMQEGSLFVLGVDARNKNDLFTLRRGCGMVFQNPDNQFVSSVVHEDVAFALENYETPREQIPELVRRALHRVALDGFEDRTVHTLSGGQKQRLAIAGVLSVEPQILIFDESTAMLDPVCRAQVLSMMRRLHEAEHTIVMITHYVEEAIMAQRVVVMDEGRVLAAGNMRQILSDTALLTRAGLEPPAAVRMYEDLKKVGIVLSHCPLSPEELAEEICRSKQNM